MSFNIIKSSNDMRRVSMVCQRSISLGITDHPCLSTHNS
jgi:hypothetical protein